MTKEKVLPLLLDNRVLNKVQEKALATLFKEIAAMNSSDRDADDWFILGYVELKDENAEEALDPFDMAIEKNPDFEAAYRFRASAYAMLKEFDKAEKDVNKAIELDEEYADAYYERAFIRKSQYKWDEAITDCDKVLELEPDALHALLLKAKTLYDAERYTDSIEVYSLVIKEDAKNIDAISSRGLAHFFSDNFEEALADVRKARLLEGGSLVSEFNMGLISSAIPEKSKEAFRHLEKAFRKDGNLLINYIEFTDSKESVRLIGKLNSIFEDIKKRKDENFYTRELHDLLERKLKHAKSSLEQKQS
jgi:tetratricopeptide (TPR) repeat protein